MKPDGNFHEIKGSNVSIGKYDAETDSYVSGGMLPEPSLFLVGFDHAENVELFNTATFSVVVPADGLHEILPPVKPPRYTVKIGNIMECTGIFQHGEFMFDRLRLADGTVYIFTDGNWVDRRIFRRRQRKAQWRKRR